MQFNLPELKKQYTLQFHCRIAVLFDYINGRLYEYLSNNGVENSSANCVKNLIQLPKDTIIMVDDFNAKNIMLRVIKFPGVKEELEISFMIKVSELKHLHFEAN